MTSHRTIRQWFMQACINLNSYDSHPEVVVIEVRITGLLERMRGVVSGEISHAADEHFAQGRMDVEEERSIDVPSAHLAKVSLVPTNPSRFIDLVKAGP